MASFALEGSTEGVTSAVDSLQKVVSSGGFSLTFFGQTLTADQVMWVDNVEQTVSAHHYHYTCHLLVLINATYLFYVHVSISIASQLNLHSLIII